MTTALNLGRPFRLPFESGGLYFLESEMRRLFPSEVVTWMVMHARTSNTADHIQISGEKLLALPEPKDLPVLLAVRFSLSFPILLSAVPLYTVDWTRVGNSPDATTAVRVLFSDGGICSNFPIHFFDDPLPGRPTFGANLRSYHPDKQDQRVWMPEQIRNNQGIRNYIPGMATEPGLTSVISFVASIVSTMQSWNDQLQTSMPGFRDRIVHISHSDDEGGMNLNMDAQVITALANGGSEAAKQLQSAFMAEHQDSGFNGWDNHRRIRLRNLLSGIDEQARMIHQAMQGQSGNDWMKVLTTSKPPSYPFTSDTQQRHAKQIIETMAELGRNLETSGKSMKPNAPRPTPEWRAAPRV